VVLTTLFGEVFTDACIYVAKRVAAHGSTATSLAQ
jgi:hypothetical protein